MAQRRFLDMMQQYPFWVLDASGFAGNPLFTVFDPVLGFSGCTTPEITVETKEIQRGNWEFKTPVVKSASVSAITLQRGARFYDSDFYNWISGAIRGVQPIRRNLVIIHFLGFRLQRFTASRTGLIQPGQSGVQAEVVLNASGQAGVPLDRIPGRAWFCGGCLPVRYKPGGDFDATSSDVSIMELDVQPEYVSELTINTVSPIAARIASLTFASLEAVEVGGF
jgi:phage tail-like protein